MQIEIDELLKWFQAEMQLQELCVRINNGDNDVSLAKLDLINHLIHHLEQGNLPPKSST